MHYIAHVGSVDLRAMMMLISSLWISLVLSSNEAWGHAWRGQEIVLFMTYDLSGEHVKVTLGLPAALTTLPQAMAHRDQNAELTDQVLATFTQEIAAELRQGSFAIFDGIKTLPKIDKIDLISKRLSQKRSKAADLAKKNRKVLYFEQASVELHTGSQDALLIQFSYPKIDPRRLKRASFRWHHDSWFVKPRRRSRGVQRSKQLSTREAPGLIIDRNGIRPITFYPNEPEVIWRAPHRLSSFNRQEERSSPVHSTASSGAWWTWSYWFGESLEKEDTPQARALLFKRLHREVYSAFDQDSDEAAYEALSRVLSGHLLDRVFQTTFNALILRDQGGARAKVTHVIPLELTEMTPDQLSKKSKSLLERYRLSEASNLDTNGFIYRYGWRVVGKVQHWGHTHRRVNDYEAIYLMTERPEGWKLTFVHPLTQRRRPELEGSL